MSPFILFSVARLSTVRVGDTIVGRMFYDPGVFTVREVVDDLEKATRTVVLDDESGEATTTFTLPADTPVVVGIKT